MEGSRWNDQGRSSLPRALWFSAGSKYEHSVPLSGSLLNAPFGAQRLLELAESRKLGAALPNVTRSARPRTAKQLSEGELDALVEAYRLFTIEGVVAA
ncbi:hypothetical protein EV643_103263 [Kribbella sp. VKM Ac-2527]|uniref:Uncharacterized protein n=1 Tax=Kribbella caucasensis TaxID=2512215 RepID=A0A4R6KJN5_9ACTN|nr:hypothetical protein EV643_103263 [Kribbella sp. VKM Ac-2527]